MACCNDSVVWKNVVGLLVSEAGPFEVDSELDMVDMVSVTF